MISFWVTCNNCLNDFWDWVLVDLKLSEKSVPRWTAAWRVTDINIPHVAFSLPFCLSDWDHILVSQSRKPSSWVVRSLLTSGDCVAKFWLCLLFLSFLKRRVSSYLLNRQGNSVVPGLLRSRRVSSYLTSRTASFCHPWELDAASRLNYLASSFPVLVQSFWQGALSIPGTFRRSRTLCNRRTCRDSEGQVHRRLWLCHDPLFSFLFLHHFRHRLSAAVQSWNSESSKVSWNGWCWTNEEDCSTNRV